MKQPFQASRTHWFMVRQCEKIFKEISEAINLSKAVLNYLDWQLMKEIVEFMFCAFHLI